MAFKIQGRVGIRVIPDSSKWNEDLRKVLQRSRRTTKFEIPVTADVSKAERTVKDFISDYSGKEVRLGVDVDAALAAASMSVVTRPRTVSIIPLVSKAAAANAMKTLAALSGGRVVGDMLTNLGKQLGNLDKNLPKIAAIATGISAIGAAAFSSLGGLVAVGGGLAQIGGAGLLLPSLFAGAAVGIISLVVALKDASTELAVLGPAMTDLGKSISGNFWEQAREPIVNMTTTLLPQLSAGFNTVSTEIGAFTSDLANALTTKLDGGVLQGMFDNMAQGLANARTGAEGMAGAIATLGSVGSTYMPALGGLVADVAGQFDSWLTTTSADGRLQGWIDGGIDALGELGSVVGSTGSILKGLFDATQNAGFGGLAGMADTLQKVADVVNGPAFQTGLTTILSGAAAGIDALGPGLSALGGAIGVLAGTIGGVFTQAGGILSTVLEGIADAISEPAFATGLTSFFEGIQTGIDAILPVMPAIGEALGSILSTAGVLAAALGPVIGELLGTLAPVLADIMVALSPVIEALGGAFADVLGILLPPLGELISALLPPLSEVLVQVADAIGPLLEAIVPLVLTGFEPFMKILEALVPVIQPLLDALIPLIELIVAMADIFITVNTEPMVAGIVLAAQVLSAILIPALQLITPILQFLADTLGVVAGVIDAVVSPALDALGGDFGGLNEVADGLATGLGATWNTIVAGVQWLAGIVGNVWDAVWGRVTAVFNTVVSTLSSGAQNAWSAVTGAFSNLTTGVQNTVGSLISFVSGIPGQILGFFSGLGDSLFSSGADMISGFIDGISSMIGSVADIAGDVMSTISDFFPHSPPKRGPLAGAGYTTHSGKALVSDFAKGMNSRISDVRAAATAATGAADFSTNRNVEGAAGMASGGTFTQNIEFLQPEDPGVLANRLGRETRRALASV